MRTSTKAASKPANAKPGKAKAKPAANAAAPATPAKPDERAVRVALTAESHAFTSKLYSGSQPVHSGKPGKLADYLDRAKRQPHAVGAGGTSERDHALLRRIVAVVPGIAKAGGAFDPSAPAIAADLGVISRLASAGYVAIENGGLIITTTGAERMRLITKAA